MLVPSPKWLDSGNNAWQLAAATFVGLQSIPGLAVLYAGYVKQKWAINSAFMCFYAFASVLVVWVLFDYNMAFGEQWFPFLGKPAMATSANFTLGQATIPAAAAGMPELTFPMATLIFFQFVFAAITPLLFLGSVVGRMNFKVWLIFVPLWSTFVYSINAFLVWGGGFWGQAHAGASSLFSTGALDYSGGYVIHLAAGVSGFVAAAVIGPRLNRDRERAVPNNLPLAAVGAGILWLGWNGFNGGDPYFAGTNASLAVLNTNLATAVALLTWVIWDIFASRERKPTFLGAINGMIAGLVGITPAAGFVNSFGAMIIGVVASSLVWMSWNWLGRTKPFKKVDDTLGVIHTHGVAGLVGGLLVGVLADPNVVIYLGNGKDVNDVTASGWLWGHHPAQILVQLCAALTIIVWDAVVTFAILRILGLLMKLRAPDELLEQGDIGVHTEEAYPDEALVGGRIDGVKA